MPAYDCFWWFLPLLLLNPTNATNTKSEEKKNDVATRTVDVSGEDDVISSSYVLPNQIFNDGKPYYARHDPVSGQLDFSAKKPAGIDLEANEVLNSKDKIVLSTGSALNIHDYLNLPVKYTSSKFVYPLVSSSYANLKYQGSNKNFVANKQPASIAASATPTFNYHSGGYFSIPKTKLMEAPTAAVVPSSTKSPSTTNTTTTVTTTKKPSITTTSPASLPGQTITTRKKFILTKLNSPTVRTTTINILPNQRLSEERITSTPELSDTSTNITLTTRHPTPQSSLFPTEPTISTKILDPVDVYHTLDQKNALNQQQVTNKTLNMVNDMFNSRIDEESAVAIDYQQNQGFDDQGNLIEPITPSKPSPFIMQIQQQRPFLHQHSTKIGKIEKLTSTLVSVNTSLPTVQKSEQDTNKEKMISENQTHFSNEYVSYQVQQPNVIKYRPMPDQINNVMIPPEQQSVAFVLGSQQQVSHTKNLGSNMDSSLTMDAPGLMYGQVINEDITNIKRLFLSNYPEAPVHYQQLPLIGSSIKSLKTPPTVDSQLAMKFTSTQIANKNQGPQELFISTNVRFPTNDEDSVMPGSLSGQPINGHAHPLSLQQMQNNHVVFPENKEKDGLNGIRSSISNVQIQQHPILTIQQQSPTFNDPLGQSPSQNMEPPPRYSTISPMSSDNRYSTPTFPGFNKLNDKNQLSSNIRLNLSLPNILPQFRPNAKILNDHSKSFKQDSGNIRLVNIENNRPYKPAASLQFAQRRQPLQNKQSRYPIVGKNDQKFSPQPNNNEINRRVYRLHQTSSQIMQYAPDRLHFHRPNSPLRSVKNHANLGTQTYKTITNANLAAFEEVINDPPQLVTPSKDYESNDDTKLEPVITLQMLQSQKHSVGVLIDDNRAGEIQVTSENDSESAAPSALHGQQAGQRGKYLDFPANTDKPKKEIANSDHRDSLLSGSEYQNTPFSVTREQPQEPILKNKNPQSLQQQTKSDNTDKFPYPIEKPDPLYIEPHPKTHALEMLVRHSTGRLSSGTETPIAIAYTPTDRILYRRNVTNQYPKFSDVNLTISVINEIRPDSRTELEKFPGDIDVRGQNFKNDFMAPFYPSVSLSAANESNKHVNQLNSWNIMSMSTDPPIYEKRNINRVDVDIQSDNKENFSTTDYNKDYSFELDNFQPDLQSGFQPIFPPGYMHIEKEKVEKMPLRDQKPLTIALTGQLTSTAISSNPIETISNKSAILTTTLSPSLNTTKKLTSTSINSKTPDITADRKKSTFETSLAALLFGNDDSFENGTPNSTELEKNKFALRNVPRMGPRNLKMS